MTSFADLATQLRERRRELGVTQQDLAFTIGVNRRVIGELERGKATVRADILLAALEALGLDVRLEPRS